MEMPISLPELGLRFYWNKRLEGSLCNKWIRRGSVAAFSKLEKTGRRLGGTHTVHPLAGRAHGVLVRMWQRAAQGSNERQVIVTLSDDDK